MQLMRRAGVNASKPWLSPIDIHELCQQNIIPQAFVNDCTREVSTIKLLQVVPQLTYEQCCAKNRMIHIVKPVLKDMRPRRL